MRLSIARKSLAAALTTALRSVPGKPTYPALGNILLSAIADSDGPRLLLSTTNLEQAITLKLPASLDLEEGKTTINARQFTELISTYEGETVNLDLSGGMLLIRCGSSKSSLKIIPANEFPFPAAWPTEEGWELDLPLFSDALSRVLFACSDDDALPVLTGVDMGSLLAATDGFRISLAEYAVAAKAIIVPAANLREALNVFEGASAVRFLVKDGVYLWTDEAVFRMPLIDANFPDWKAIMPTTFAGKLQAKTGDLVLACKQAAIIAPDDLSRIHLEAKKGDGSLVLSAASEETGETTLAIPAEVGGDIDIWLNARYLREAVEACRDTDAHLSYNSAVKPVLITPANSNGYRCLLMPLHVSGG